MDAIYARARQVRLGERYLVGSSLNRSFRFGSRRSRAARTEDLVTTLPRTLGWINLYLRSGAFAPAAAGDSFEYMSSMTSA